MAVGALLSMFFLVREGGASDAYVTAAEEALIGEQGVALSDLLPSGKVRVGDREWTATPEEGDRVRAGAGIWVVSAYSGGVLKVSSHPPQDASASRSRLAAVLRGLQRKLKRADGPPGA